MKYKAVICFSAIDWSFLKQRTQYIMGGLAARGLKVLFIENTGVRNPRLSDLSRLYARLKSSVVSAKAISASDIPDNIEVFSPLAMPMPYSYTAVLYNYNYLKKRIANFLKKNSLNPSEVIFWTYLATPVVLRLAECYTWGRTVYDLVSDPKLVDSRVGIYEKRLLGKADIVLFASYVLYDQCRCVARNPVVLKDGFNTELLSAELSPCMMDSLPRPRFLYIGGINHKIWPDMLEALSDSYPGGSIVLMGPKTGDAVIPNRCNIHLLPARNRYCELAPFLAGADAGIIPYRSDQYSGVMHPAKLNEYLVFGLPVVATATPELERISYNLGDGFLYLGKNPDEFVRAASSALENDNRSIKRIRSGFTLGNTWGARVEDLVKLLDG